MTIALEGIEGAGKSLHAKLLSEYLTNCGYSCVLVKEPTGFLGGMIKEQNNSPEVNALLFAADRLKQFKEVVEPALEEGKIVITDRSVFSSFAYQSAQGVRLEWLEMINKNVPLPDLVIILDVGPQVGLQHIAERNETSIFDKKVNNVAFQDKVRFAYHRLTEKYSDIATVIDVTNRSIQEVQTLIRKIVSARLEKQGLVPTEKRLVKVAPSM